MIKDLLVDLDRLEIIGEIGYGGFGIVYLVKEIETGKQLAAKVMKDECITTQEQIQFFQEITIFSRVKNPAVLSLFGFNMMNFKSDHYPTIITEYMPNGSLDQILKNSLFPSSKKYIILLGIAEGMKYLHSQKIIHCDLKPGNILLDSNFYPHICDFGQSEISQLSISKVKIETCRGTPAYMAPEVFSEDQFTYKIDVFSFSFIAFELLTGISPFSEYKSIFKLQCDIKNNKRPNLETIKDEEIRSFLQKCWSPNPEERPRFKEIVDEIKKINYRKMLNANDKEVIQYLRLFGEDLKITKSSSQNLSFIKQKRDEINKKLNLNSKNIRPNNQSNLNFSIFSINKKTDKTNRNENSFYNESNYNKILIDSDNDIDYFSIANRLRNGEGFDIDKEKAAYFYKKSAEKGNTEAMFNYAVMLKEGEGIKMNKVESSRFFKMAADRGHEKSILAYSNLLRNGDEGIPMNKKESIRYLKMSADKGNESSMLKLGCILYHGDGIPVNKSEAATYFKMAADRGSEKAMFNYSHMLKYGDGIPMNKKEAANYMKLAADKGNKLAMDKYGNILYHGDGIPVNKKEASFYFKMSADKGHEKAIPKYAYMLYYGDGIQMNKEEAAIYYKKSADFGDSDSMYKYASMLMNGIGVHQNKKEAARYFKMSADNGNKKSMHCYYIMLKNGVGIQQNIEEAARYKKMSDKKMSDKKIDSFTLRKGDEFNVNKIENAQCLKESAEKENTEYMLNYAVMLNNGEEIKKEKGRSS